MPRYLITEIRSETTKETYEVDAGDKDIAMEKHYHGESEHQWSKSLDGDTIESDIDLIESYHPKGWIIYHT